MDAIYQAGLWQLPPAGSVDASAVGSDGAVDLGHQIRVELQEELGLSPEAIGKPRPLCVVEHPGTHVSDLGLALATPETGSFVLAAHRRSGNAEYDPLRVVAFADLSAFAAQLGDTLVPSARVFLAHALAAAGRHGARRCMMSEGGAWLDLYAEQSNQRVRWPSVPRHGGRRPAIHDLPCFPAPTTSRGWRAFARHDAVRLASGIRPLSYRP